MCSWVDVISSTTLETITRYQFTHNGLRLLVLYDEGRLFALQDRCSHSNYPLFDGPVERGVITCTRHGARFLLNDGAALCPPAHRPLTVFPARIYDGMIQICIENQPEFS